jgi:hypothetical protein
MAVFEGVYVNSGGVPEAVKRPKTRNGGKNSRFIAQ